MYQVLYRKYRPQVFSDVYGQDHVITTLKNEIKENRISHAYLFTGSRGTGKTTCAKILAKAVNCENSVDGEPCNECEVCKGLDSGSIYDVVEIDAASNNGVGNIRDLREEANYTPSRGKYRVYIIDEVHMLSTGAFNALLKTLEEPPAHVIFILATTEVHKLPATILSRCQRFDFKRIQPETMAVRLNEVAELEGIKLDKDAAILIARIADGALRDGLSILDQCAGRDKNVTSALVSDVAGLAGKEALFDLSKAISEKDSSSALSIVSNLHENSYDMERLCTEMINHFRNLLIVKTVRKSRELIICTDDEFNNTKERAKSFTIENIIYALDLFQSTLGAMNNGAAIRTEMEMALIKLCEPKLEESTASILDRISILESALKNGIKIQEAQPTKSVNVQTVETKPVEEKPKQVIQEIENTPTLEAQNVDAKSSQSIDENDDLKEENNASQIAEEGVSTEPTSYESSAESNDFAMWDDVLDVIYKNDLGLFSILNNSKASQRGEFVVIDSSNPTIAQFIKQEGRKKTIIEAIKQVTGKDMRIGIKKKVEEKVEKRDPLEDLINKAQTNNLNINFQ